MDLQTALQVYKELADWYERQGQAAMRDRFLVLAAEAAFSAGNPEEAERLRQRLLQGNPHHMLKPFSSFAQALQSTNIQIYIHDLQVNYPPQTAEQLLRSLRSGDPPTQPAAHEEDRLGTEMPINPVIEIRDTPSRPPATEREPLKVYPLRDEPNRPAPRPPFSLPGRGEKGRTPAVPPPPRPSLPRRPQPMLPRSAAPDTNLPPPPTETAAPAGSWLTLILFGMIVTAGIALALYTLARPFLPPL